MDLFELPPRGMFLFLSVAFPSLNHMLDTQGTSQCLLEGIQPGHNNNRHLGNIHNWNKEFQQDCCMWHLPSHKRVQGDCWFWGWSHLQFPGLEGLSRKCTRMQPAVLLGTGHELGWGSCWPILHVASHNLCREELPSQYFAVCDYGDKGIPCCTNPLFAFFDGRCSSVVRVPYNSWKGL